MVRNLLLVSLAALPAISSAAVMDQAEKFGYEHIHLDVGAGTTNEEWLDNSNATTVGLGGNYLFTENWLFNVDYSAQFFHPDDFTLRIDRLLFGGGYRYGVTEQFDIYGLYGIGAIKAKATDDKTDNTLSSDSELIQAVTVGVNYLLSEKLIATAEVELNRSDIVDENNFKIGLNYQWHKVIGTGLFYQFRDTDYSGESSDYVNEVGLSLKFVY
ncbi:porin family protein [Vibrio alginolyticus]|uniref:Porin family protein n=2 Tax=Vibrio alginolyticus TaxID=663 RepID=A0ABX4XGT7_VIBAL|nr:MULTISPECIES: outer membrane beta-barrel protein [Vibrio]MDF5688341.1 outer membrane beta-barrel protein [Vibrio parahaemolyticus]MDW1969249.1 outer membrane beta-barrel protein [Vibrio sp. 945]NAW53495.1 outer membrane beta-barrel protein [Vibrio sp. V41_P2S12T139]NAW95320.1 outer membrane beta-barrel protein [Vibrio sp. V42_P2S4T144]AGV16815.1 putative outer membrane protein, Ail and OmpX [Vibrio alginolyticus NBRC 15630 = ATCC 17749]